MNPLENLKDIHLPAPIEAWPPAYGWWILLVLVLLIIALIIKVYLKARKLRAVKRQAIQQLSKVDISASNAPAELNQLLKRTAMFYFPTRAVEKMYGQSWQQFLSSCLSTKHASQVNESLAAMQAGLYQQQPVTESEARQYLQACEIWLKHALPPRKKRVADKEQPNV